MSPTTSRMTKKAASLIPESLDLTRSTSRSVTLTTAGQGSIVVRGHLRHPPRRDVPMSATPAQRSRFWLQLRTPHRDNAPVRGIGYLFVASGSILWATNGIVSSLLFKSGAVSPTTLTATRIYGSALILGIGVATVLPGLSRRSLVRLAAFGIVGISLPQWLFYESISRVDVPIALVIVYTAPVLVTAFERVVLRKRMPATVYVAIIVAIGGVMAAVLGNSGGFGALSGIGLLFAVGAMAAYSCQILLAAIQPLELRPLQRVGGAMVFGSVLWLMVDPVWTLPFGVATDPVGLGPRANATAAVWLLIVYITVLGTVVPYALLVSGAPRIGPGAASVTGMTEPIVASVLAWLVLDQALTAVQIIGIGVALCGVTAAETFRGRARGEPVDVEEVFAS
jgi:drug/metabolite transporter (DMT)-like permease